MDNAHLHLVVNHLPIIFPIVGVIILLIGVFTKSEVSKRNAYVIFILGAIASIAAMATGEGAEEAVENIQGVTENLIHEHEESAELFAGLSYLLGGLSALALFFSFRNNIVIKRIVTVVIFIIAIFSLYFAQKAGNTGGEIRHTEIRSGASLQNADQNENENAGENKGKEEEEGDED